MGRWQTWAMTQPVQGSPNAAGERWNVNMPAVIGAVFVFLIGVIVWVIASSGGDDDASSETPTTLPTTTNPTVAPAPESSVPGTTTPAPMPDPSAVSTSTTLDPSEPSVTTAPGADPDAVPGDLAIPGRPMQQPGCDDTYITVIASAVGAQASAGGITNVLDAYPGSNYLRTDQTCPSLTPDIDGEPVYVVFFGPFAFASDACAARAQGTEGAYARRLTTEVGPDHGVACG